MPWKKRSHLDERMSFIARMQSGEKVTDLCKEFGISRKTAYKFIGRYEKHGPSGLHGRACLDLATQRLSLGTRGFQLGRKAPVAALA